MMQDLLHSFGEVGGTKMDFQWTRIGPMFQEPRWISCYSNQHLILLVGEGNFSFAASLGNAFGAATNVVATSLDSRDELLKKYGPTAEWNTFNLMHRGALVFHGFDACNMAIQQKNLPGSIQFWLFNYIVFNFPHAGFMGKENDAHMLRKHRELVRNFFAIAKEMLSPGGQVHVRHKLGHPYDEWKLEELALSSGLKLMVRVPFCLDQFPGYQNCRGDGFRADESFRLGPADTYIFVARDEEPPPKISQIEACSRKKEKQKQKQVHKEKKVEKQRQVEKEKQVEKQRQLKEQRQIEWKKQKQDFGLTDRQLACLKKKIKCRGRGSSETPLHQDGENDQMRLSLEENAKITHTSMTGFHRSALASSKRISQPPEFQLSAPTNSAENSVSCDSCVPNKTVQVRLRSLREKAISQARASDKTTLQQVAAHEVARLEKVKLTLGPKKLQTLEILKSDLRLIMDCTNLLSRSDGVPQRRNREREDVYSPSKRPRNVDSYHSIDQSGGRGSSTDYIHWRFAGSKMN